VLTEALLRDKHVGPLEGFRSKAGWPFTAELRLVFDDGHDTGLYGWDYLDELGRELDSRWLAYLIAHGRDV
jgi:hypothetical protein